MSKRISYEVHGVVQGVNFRSWTVDQAKSQNLTGFVKNTADGTVLGEAQGDQSSLDKFIEKLHDGPRHAKVNKVEKKEISTKEGEKGFSQ